LINIINFGHLFGFRSHQLSFQLHRENFMSRASRIKYAVLSTAVLVLASACALLSSPTTESSTAGDTLPTSSNDSSATLPALSSNSADDFPLTPNPIAVHATLDTANAVSDEVWGIMGGVDAETADGVKFSLLMAGQLLSRDADGNLLPASGSEVTVTPISAIDDIPFSQGYLAAVHIGPEGLMMVTPATLSMTIPGEYDTTKLIGFAADGTGEDFHLFPITTSTYDGNTSVYFSPTHFSLYGVALVTQQEIEAQQGHPPVNPASQDEEELAPLLPLLNTDPYSEDQLTPLQSKIQLQLGKSYNRLVKPDLDRLPGIACNRVDVVAYNFNAWRAKVDAANQTELFQKQINQDATTLLSRLTDCAKVTCESCLGNQPGNKLDKAAADTLTVLAAFASDMAGVMDDMDQVSYWSRLTIQCSEEAGLPSPFGESTLGGETAPGPTETPLVCK
jgi:hypothetical protein